jgi:hypothetical protein
MALPSGLKFVDRRADYGGAHYFQCVRSGHPAGQKRIRRGFEKQRDRETYITRHDALYHDELLAAQLGIEQAPILGEVIADFLQHIRDLYKQGKRDAKTVTYYEGICKQLLEHFDYSTPINTIGRRQGLAYVKKRQDAARLLKELKVIKRLQGFAGLAAVWDLPTDDVSPERIERESIPIEDIRDFLGAMSPKSMEYTFAAAKFITMLRNEELYAANVGDVTIKDDGTGELEYRLRNKQTGSKVRHVTYLPAALVSLLRPLVRRKATAPLFHIEGRRLTPASLRKRFIRASERATAKRRKADPEANAVEITSIGQFRHEAATIAIDALESTHAVSEHLDHKDERTTRTHYKLRKRAQSIEQSKRVTEVTASKLVH